MASVMNYGKINNMVRLEMYFDKLHPDASLPLGHNLPAAQPTIIATGRKHG
jgi:hypothetical protein